MALRVKVLQTKAEKFERKELLNYKIDAKAMVAIDEVLHRVYAVRRPNSSDYDVRRDLVRVFNEIAKELYGNSKDVSVVEFGSFSMDIFNAKSDLDLSVNFGNGAVEITREKRIQTLRKFAKKFYALQSKGHVSGVLPITTAKVPVLKVVDCGTGVECDISVENRDGILKSQIINMISTIDDRFRKLSFLMKAWAKEHDINSSKDKTLNSLSIVLLVAFHLQTRNPPILPPFSTLLKDGSDPALVLRSCRKFMNYGRGNKETLSELFFSLLIKLSAVEKLWHKGLCASVCEGCWVSKTFDSKIACISVEDFTDRSQNVARAVGKSEVKSIFKCIQLSIRHVSAFMDGRIEGSMLMDLLFDPNGVYALVRTGRMPPMGNLVAMPSGSHERTGGAVPPKSILTKRSKPGDSSRSSGSWSPTRIQDAKRRRQGETGGQVHAGGQGMHAEQWGLTQQPSTTSSLPVWMRGIQSPWMEGVDWRASNNAYTLLVPSPSPLPYGHLQTQVPSMNVPFVHPSSSSHRHPRSSQKNHQI